MSILIKLLLSSLMRRLWCCTTLLTHPTRRLASMLSRADNTYVEWTELVQLQLSRASQQTPLHINSTVNDLCVSELCTVARIAAQWTLNVSLLDSFSPAFFLLLCCVASHSELWLLLNHRVLLHVLVSLLFAYFCRWLYFFFFFFFSAHSKLLIFGPVFPP